MRTTLKSNIPLVFSAGCCLVAFGVAGWPVGSLPRGDGAEVGGRDRARAIAPAEVSPQAEEGLSFGRSRFPLLDELDDQGVMLCQAICAPPAANGPNYPVRCKFGDFPYRADAGFEEPISPAFQTWQQGEYVARARLPHVPSYRLRVDDELDFVFRLTREETARPYQINVGDEIRVESFTDRNLDRSLIVQPDGTVTLALLGQVRATHRTITQLRDDLEERYKKFYKVPSINVTPLKVNTRLEDLRATVDSRAGNGGQTRRGKITPEGTVRLPGVGTIPAQGLSLDEFHREINARYAAEVEGLEVTPILVTRAPRYVYVQGEVKNPGRYAIDAPMTVMQALTMAGGWNIGANIEQVVVFRRDEDWRLVATMIDLRQSLLGRRSNPVGEIWISDADLVIVPKGNLLLFDNFVNMVFTRGLYSIVPFTSAVTFTSLNYLNPAAAAASTVVAH